MYRLPIGIFVRISAVLCALAALAVLLLSEAAASEPAAFHRPATVRSDPTVRLETTPTQGQVGDLFTTRIYADNIANANGLGNWQATVDYVPAILTLNGVTFGADLGSTGRFVGNVGPTFSIGNVTLGQFSFGTQPGPTGSSIHLATIVWRGVGDGVSELNLNSSSLLDIDATPLTPLTEIDSWVVVGDPPAPNHLWLPMAFRSSASRR
ncbi:MAG: cohesin domain-containing protein [Anaerolineae bacterium]